MYSIVYACTFVKCCFYEYMLYNSGEKDFFHLFVTADSVSEAIERGLCYINDHCDSGDISILSVLRVNDE